MPLSSRREGLDRVLGLLPNRFRIHSVSTTTLHPKEVSTNLLKNVLLPEFTPFYHQVSISSDFFDKIPEIIENMSENSIDFIEIGLTKIFFEEKAITNLHNS